MRTFRAFVLTALLLVVASTRAADKDENPDVDALIKQLQGKAPAARVKAAQALGKLGAKAKEAIAALNEATKDKDESVRAAARKALESVTATEKFDPKLEPLVKDLKGKNLKARWKALDALVEMGDAAKPVARSVSDLMMAEFPKNRDKYLEALEKLDPDAQRVILAFFTEMTQEKQFEAIDSMESLGEDGKTCLPVLVKYYFLDRSGKLGRRDFAFAQKILPVLVKIAPDDKVVTQTVLGALTTPSRSPLDSTVKMKAIESVKELKAEPKMVVQALIAATADPFCRTMAIEALGAMGKIAKDAVPVLMKLKFNSNKDVQEAARAALDLIKE